MINYQRKRKFNKQDRRIKTDYRQLLYSLPTVAFIALTTKSSEKSLNFKIQKLRKILNFMIKHNGLECVCKRIKTAEKQFLLNGKTSWFSLKHVTGSGITPEATKVLLSIHRSMYVKPKLNVDSLYHKAGSVKQFLKEHSMSIKFVLKNKLFNIQAYPDVQVFTNRYWKTLLSNSRYNPFTYDPTVDSNDRTGGDKFPLVVSTKGRTNGNCMTSQRYDEFFIQKEDLEPSIRYLYREWKYKFTKVYGDCKEEPKGSSSKLFLIQDKSCKTRVIAIFDTFSQVSLRPMHKMLQDQLNLYPKDFTFNHLKGIKSLNKKDWWFCSIDLSKATDTIPRHLSFFILEHMVRHCVTHPKKFVDAVRTVMVSRSFNFEGKSYRYLSGQPMGAYGSFPLMAITNHFITLLSYHESFGKVFDYKSHNYAIVGDDLVISCRNRIDLDKWREKHSQLCKELNLPINHSKSIYGQNSYEFCRRIIVDGHIVSFPSWNSHYQSVKLGDPYSVLQLLLDYDYRIPSYSSLISLRRDTVYKRRSTVKFIFHKRMVKNLLALTGLKLQGQPKVEKIPTDVLSHADRCLQIADSVRIFDSDKLLPIKTEDPYLSRLNYNIKIVRLLSAYYRKYKSFWLVGSKSRCNVFYLSYIDCYKNAKRIKKRIYKPDYDNGRSFKLRHYSMSSKTLWHTLKK